MKKKGLGLCAAVLMLACTTACSNGDVEQTSAEVTDTEVSVQTSEEETETVAPTTVAIPDFDLSSVETFEVSSENLHDGVWDDIISNTDAGENLSPQLAWEEVEGATSYAIYMIDTSAANWLHLRASGITDTVLDTGAIGALSYVGPYPPSGTHDYVVYVFALRANPIKIRGAMDSSNSSTDTIFAALDVNEDGESGNVISYGTLTGTYSAKE